MDKEGGVISGSGSNDLANQIPGSRRSTETGRSLTHSGSSEMTSPDEQKATEQRTQIAVQLATLQGKIDTVIARMEAGDRQGEQLVALTKDQIKFIAADTGELKAIVRELAAKTDVQVSTLSTKIEAGLTIVRTDLERQVGVVRGDLDKQIRETVEPVSEKVKTYAGQIDDLRLWRARVIGMAIGASILSSGITAAVLKGLGAG